MPADPANEPPQDATTPEPEAVPGAGAGAGASEAVLRAMLERLYGALTRGPGINCRPHRSRQRVDLTDLDALGDAAASEVLGRLLGEPAEAELLARVPPPDDPEPGSRRRAAEPEEPEEPEDDGRRPDPVNLEGRDPYREPRQPLPEPEDAEAPEAPEPTPAQAYAAQRKLLVKLRALEDEARTYLHDTGVHALHLGYPLLSLPPGFAGGGKRILAPVAFTPIELDAKPGVKPGVRLRAQGEDEDRLVVNPALLAWLERTLGERLDLAAAGLMDPEDPPEAPEAPETSEPREEAAAGADRPAAEPVAAPPVVEIAALVRAVADALGMPDDALGGWAGEAPGDAVDALGACPPTERLPKEPAVVNAAVLGLFPAGNQGLLRDTREMIEAGASGGSGGPEGLAGAFLSPGRSFEDLAAASEGPGGPDGSGIRQERFVTLADPSQALAVASARTEPCLVLHGPPGTGKSQTITNVIGDHLARGQRVLFVCDKQTALDVVYHKLEGLGLAGLCARVHDPQRDRRALYMSVRETLAGLVDAEPDPKSEQRLEKADAELEEVHAELTALHAALMEPPGEEASANGEESFHTLTGRFLGSEAADLPAALLPNTREADLEPHARTLDLVLERGAQLGAATHPWLTAGAADPERGLDAHLGRPPRASRDLLAAAVAAAEALDALDAEGPTPPPFEPDRPLAEQDAARAALLADLRWLRGHPDAEAAARAAGLTDAEVDRLLGVLVGAKADAAAVVGSAVDPAVAAVLADDPPGPASVAEQTGALEQYLDGAGRWYAFALLGPRKLARNVLRRYGKTLSVANAGAARDALAGLAVRRRLDAALAEVGGGAPDRRLPADAELLAGVARWERLLGARARARREADPLRGPLLAALRDPAAAATLAESLERSPARSAALTAAEEALAATGILSPTYIEQRATATKTAFGGAAGEVRPLLESVGDLEAVLRFAEGLGSLPGELREALGPLLDAGVSPAAGRAALVKRCLGHELARRVAAEPRLSRLDPAALEHAAARFAKLEQRKRGLVRDVILHRWVGAWRRRLLADTQTRLNSVGTAVRQRLFVTGKRAMRLRQVIRLGARLGRKEDAASRLAAELAADPRAVRPAVDPLLDLRPVWLASPEAVAQCFPREAVFDLIVFDEASQLRLEEAIPVLTRGRRVVIAGDPQQLPPTRFFEAAFDGGDADAGGAGAVETEDDLFEAQQRGTEDLLSSALDLDAASTYLDVHYRSEDPGLIRFSNEHFYGGRLQALPVAPGRRRGGGPAVELTHVGGTYAERTNAAEAAAVVEAVRGLLKGRKPPSVGVACFNTAQRDAIAEALELAAADDPAFGRRLAAARALERGGQREGLFVKNLENVQGDERDHLILSTTYGPDPAGRFHRRFGPLGVAGGGRRLNVLVTRARAKVHVLTSIPASAWAGLQRPEGRPSGSWLLFAYLAMADAATAAAAGPGAPDAEPEPGLRVHRSDAASPLAEAVGARVAAARPDARVDVHLGNEGFLLDVAAQEGGGAARTALIDFARYAAAADPVRWDLYRSGILRWRGWEPARLWSPTLLRDAEAALRPLVG